MTRTRTDFSLNHSPAIAACSRKAHRYDQSGATGGHGGSGALPVRLWRQPDEPVVLIVVSGWHVARDAHDSTEPQHARRPASDERTGDVDVRSRPGYKLADVSRDYPFRTRLAADHDSRYDGDHPGEYT